MGAFIREERVVWEHREGALAGLLARYALRPSLRLPQSVTKFAHYRTDVRNGGGQGISRVCLGSQTADVGTSATSASEASLESTQCCDNDGEKRFVSASTIIYY